MERGQFVLSGVVRLGRVVIPSSNTPVRSPGSTLVPAPVWKYKGPACTITLTYQVGYWGLTFNGMTAIITEVFSQPASDTLSDFTATLKGVSLTGLSGAADNRYDMEMWFKGPAFADQGAIFTDCCEIAVAGIPLQFSSVSAQRVVVTNAPDWSTIVFHCTITNPNAQSATERIHVFINNWNQYYGKWSGPMELGYFDLTLPPGESSVFTWDGNQANLEYGSGPDLSVNTTCHMWLQDDLGNKSAEGVA